MSFLLSPNSTSVPPRASKITNLICIFPAYVFILSLWTCIHKLFCTARYSHCYHTHKICSQPLFPPLNIMLLRSVSIHIDLSSLLTTVEYSIVWWHCILPPPLLKDIEAIFNFALLESVPLWTSMSQSIQKWNCWSEGQLWLSRYFSESLDWVPTPALGQTPRSFFSLSMWQ